MKQKKQQHNRADGEARDFVVPKGDRGSRRWDRLEAATKPPEGAPHGWIQWKGTDVCMDVYCTCGVQGHIDRDFAYHYKCLACGRFFDLSAYVLMVEVPPGELDESDKRLECTATDSSLAPNETIE